MKRTVVTFKTAMPIEATMDFEREYEPELRLDLEEKKALVAAGYAVWMFVDGALAGETYAVSPTAVGDEIDDIDAIHPLMLYCYSTTILGPFRGRGLAKVLVAYSLGQLRQAGFTTIVGHATSPAMVHVRASFGARFGPVHEGWFGTRRVARLYRIDLE